MNTNKALSFEKFSVLEKKGALKKLVGKDPDEELTTNDAKKLGKKICIQKSKRPESLGNRENVIF